MSNIRRLYNIDYAVCCSVGKVRKNNEDNFYTAGEIRTDVMSNEDAEFFGNVSSSDNELFAVFDGMGGEACGEVASFIAASYCKDFCKDKEQYEEYLYELCDILNRKVCEETENRSLVMMGTTAAMVQFGKNAVYVLNVGDSRIYKVSRKKMNMISQDHVAYGYRGKAPLTKFLGLDSKDEKLKPYIAMGKYKAGDTYLICTDGITDMLSEDEILSILNSENDAKQTARDLVNKALEVGGIDNATAIVLQVHSGKVRR